MTAGDRLLFGGCSAGAIGAMINLDTVAAVAGESGVSVKGFLDAAALVDIYPTGWPWSPDLTPLQTLIAELVTLLQPPLASACVTKGYIGDHAWKCFFSAYRLPLISTPFFANAVQFDDFELQFDTDNLGPSTPAQFAFVNSFQPAFLDLIASLPAGTGVYSPTCLVHCLSGQPTYSSFLVNNISMNSALNAWYFADQPTRVISPCTGFACTQACGVDAKGLPCNLGGADASCAPVALPTTLSDEQPPATSDAPKQLPSDQGSDNVRLSAGSDTQIAAAVALTESSLTSSQQAGLSGVIARAGSGGGTSDSESSDDGARGGAQGGQATGTVVMSSEQARRRLAHAEDWAAAAPCCGN